MSPLAGLLATLAAVLPAADSAPAQPAQLEAGLSGNWTGALQYRDYQTDKMTTLTQTLDVRALADGVTVIAIANFDDGPKAGAVFITSVSLFHPKSGTVDIASFRRNDDSSLETQKVTTSAYADAEHWTLTYSRTGKDGGAPAEIRITEARSGDHLASVEEYRPVGDLAAAWKFRNRTDLARTPK